MKILRIEPWTSSSEDCILLTKGATPAPTVNCENKATKKIFSLQNHDLDSSSYFVLLMQLDLDHSLEPLWTITNNSLMFGVK